MTQSQIAAGNDKNFKNKLNIAVIGGGISGLGAAWRLSEAHNVTLFEALPRLGGHARTVKAGRDGTQPVDTGFIVFNHVNYPNLVKMFEKLSVPIAQSNMSFAASLRDGAIEYGLLDLSTIFAQKKNLFSPKFLGMLRDIMKFNKNASALCRANPQASLGEFLALLGTGEWFRDYYLLPFSGAIWSTPKSKMLSFPARALVEFFENHALLGYSGQHQWYTVKDGSRNYVALLAAQLKAQGVDIRCATPVNAIRRRPNQVDIKAHRGEWESFDHVVLATHSDDSLSFLADASPDEQKCLGAIRYQPNNVVLHVDASLMPRHRKTWSSWNYLSGSADDEGRIGLTYWMNSLQPIPKDDPLFVTLNCEKQIDERLIYDQVTLRHPVFDKGAFAAQHEIRAFNGAKNTWFCGAWMRNGFHEDGLSTAIDVADQINAIQAARIAAE